VAGIPTFRDLIRSANPGPQVGSNWSKANVHGIPGKTPTITPVVTFSPTLTITATSTRTNTQTHTPTPTITRTLTRTQTPTRSGTPVATATNTISATQTRTNSATQTRTCTRTRTQTPTYTRSRTQTPTPTPGVTASRTYTPTYTRSRTQTATQSRTRTQTATYTLTKSNSPTVSGYSTPTPTCTRSRTATQTPTRTKTPTLTFNCATPTPTPTQTRTNTQTRTRTKTRTQAISPTSVPTSGYIDCYTPFVNNTNTTFSSFGLNSVSSITAANSFTYNYINCSGGNINTSSWIYPNRNIVNVSGVSYAACWTCLNAESFSTVTCCGNSSNFYQNGACTLNVEFSNYIMITDRHFLVAAHNTPHNQVPGDSQYGGLITGYNINFIKPDGNCVKATIDCFATNSDGLQGCYFNQTSVLNGYYTDVAIGKLAAPITDPDIKIYKFAELKNFSGGESIPAFSFPIIVGGGRSFGTTTCLDNAFAVGLNNQILPWSCGSTSGGNRITLNTTTNLSTACTLLPDRTLWFPYGLYSGDSGNPWFLVYNGEVLLLSMTRDAAPAGPNYAQSAFLNEVQSVINSQLGGDGTINRVNIWKQLA